MAFLSQEKLDSEIQPRIRIQGKVIFSQAMRVCACVCAYAREREAGVYVRACMGMRGRGGGRERRTMTFV